MLTSQYGKAHNPSRKLRKAGVGSKATIWKPKGEGHGLVTSRRDLVDQRNKLAQG